MPRITSVALALSVSVRAAPLSTSPPARSTTPLPVLVRVRLVVRSTFVASLKSMPSSAVMLPATFVCPLLRTVKAFTSMASPAPSLRTTSPLPASTRRLKSPATSPPSRSIRALPSPLRSVRSPTRLTSVAAVRSIEVLPTMVPSSVVAPLAVTVTSSSACKSPMFPRLVTVPVPAVIARSRPAAPAVLSILVSLKSTLMPAGPPDPKPTAMSLPRSISPASTVNAVSTAMSVAAPPAIVTSTALIASVSGSSSPYTTPRSLTPTVVRLTVPTGAFTVRLVSPSARTSAPNVTLPRALVIVEVPPPLTTRMSSASVVTKASRAVTATLWTPTKRTAPPSTSTLIPPRVLSTLPLNAIAARFAFWSSARITTSLPMTDAATLMSASSAPSAFTTRRLTFRVTLSITASTLIASSPRTSTRSSARSPAPPIVTLPGVPRVPPPPILEFAVPNSIDPPEFTWLPFAIVISFSPASLALTSISMFPVPSVMTLPSAPPPM